MSLPDDIRFAFLEAAKLWVLRNYAGGKKCLDPWSEHYASLTTLRSFNLPGNRAQNLRRLVQLADEGLLIEKPRRRKGAVRSFTLPQPQLDQIGEQAVRNWEAIGYVVGQTMDEIVSNQPNSLDVNLERLSQDLDYWNALAPDEAATHYCTQSNGFEYLDEGEDCDIAKPGTVINQDQTEKYRAAIRRLKAFIIVHHGAGAKVLQEVNELLALGDVDDPD